MHRKCVCVCGIRSPKLSFNYSKLNFIKFIYLVKRFYINYKY